MNGSSSWKHAANTLTNRMLRRVFTLLELLVVITIITVIMCMLLPVLAQGRALAYRAQCLSNIRQLGIANNAYADDFDGKFVDSGDYGGQLVRWHGRRKTMSDPFDFQRSALRSYMEAGVKECPSKRDFVQLPEWDYSYEKGCGGYGYNLYIGGSGNGMGTMPIARQQRLIDPDNTIMFCDTASTKGGKLIEYSIATAPWYDFSSPPSSYFYLTSTPNCHFRHAGGTCNVIWGDGHANSDTRAFYRDSGVEPLGEFFQVGYIGEKAMSSAIGGGGTMLFSYSPQIAREMRLYDLAE